MDFRLNAKRRRQRPGLEEQTFTIGRLWMQGKDGPKEITEMMDRSYGYRSRRELAWHLADRFSVPPRDVRLDIAA